MKEALFILFVVGLLAALTAIRYRKQVTGMIGIAHIVKETTRSIKQGSKSIASDDAKSIPLVNCSKCGVWVPQNKSIKMRGIYYCSKACLAAVAS